MIQPDLDFPTLIRKRGFRVTPQRQLIMEALRDGDGHSSPDEIYQRVLAKAPAVNRTTVYRNLDFLCEMRLAVAAQVGSHLYYEPAGMEPHHHLICRRCDLVEQIGHGVVRDLFERIDREHAFLIDMDHLTLFGLCAHCRELEDSSPSL